MFGKSTGVPACGFDKKPCIEERCVFYMQVEGQHPQTGEKISGARCAVVALAFFQADAARQSIRMQSDIESMRNEVVKSNQKVQLSLSVTVDAMRTLLSGVNEAWQKHLTHKPREINDG